LIWLPLLLLGISTAQAADNKDMPAQAARGKAIFFDKEKKNHCATCHELAKAGTAVGPNLTDIARLSPKGIEVSIMSSRTVHTKEIELKTKVKMPAMVVSETPKELTVYNLGASPPERLVLDKETIYAVRDNSTWRHPPESTEASKEMLADVISYIRFVAFGDTKGVKPEDLE
jgi:mono/diheme cytochrome c family protein